MKIISPLKKLLVITFILMAIEFFKLWVFLNDIENFQRVFVPLSVITSVVVLVLLLVASSFSRAFVDWRGVLERVLSGENEPNVTAFRSNDEMSRFSLGLKQFAKLVTGGGKK